jgi:hypothetical protein
MIMFQPGFASGFVSTALKFAIHGEFGGSIPPLTDDDDGQGEPSPGESSELEKLLRCFPCKSSLS